LPEKRESIVIVEPDAGQAAALAELLTSSGYRASLADSQAEGFRLVQTSPVDLFLLRADLMDLQCCKRARGDQRVGGDGSHESFVVADRRTSGARAGIGFGRGTT